MSLAVADPRYGAGHLRGGANAVRLAPGTSSGVPRTSAPGGRLPGRGAAGCNQKSIPSRVFLPPAAASAGLSLLVIAPLFFHQIKHGMECADGSRIDERTGG